MHNGDQSVTATCLPWFILRKIRLSLSRERERELDVRLRFPAVTVRSSQTLRYALHMSDAGACARCKAKGDSDGYDLLDHTAGTCQCCTSATVHCFTAFRDVASRNWPTLTIQKLDPLNDNELSQTLIAFSFSS